MNVWSISLNMSFSVVAFPFVKNPEDNPVYSVHFSRQWQDTMLLSLHNFLSIIFQVGKRYFTLHLLRYKFWYFVVLKIITASLQL